MRADSTNCRIVSLGTTRDSPVLAASRGLGLLEGAHDTVGDEEECRAALPLPRFACRVREDKHGCAERWVLGPADLSLVEHALAHHIRARALEQLLDKLIIGRGLSARQTYALQ